MTVDPTAETAAEQGREARGPAAGDMLGKYRLDRVLGVGGMGIVWAAFDPDLERAVAIKLLRSTGDEPTLRTRLLREARAMARLKHPNVLTVYEVGTSQNRDYIAMELVDGQGLEAWLAARPPREEIVAALLAAGRGLAAAHAAGLVHRDFKPHNVLRSRDGHVYVTDFGLARGQIEEGPEVIQVQMAATALPDDLATGSQLPRRAMDSVLDSPLTQTGVLIGTPAYMAPEQFAGRSPDARSDQFAFCVTAWEALAGVRPFRGSNLAELERAAATGEAQAADLLPPRIRAVLRRGLDPSPERRWPDLESLLQAFGEAQVEPARQPPRRPKRLRLLGGVAVALAVGGGVLYSRTGGGLRSAKSTECGPAEKAFAGAWSPDIRSRVIEAHSSWEIIGGIGILDEVRQHWLSDYRSICSRPLTAKSRARLACLLETRDAVARVTEKLARPGSKFEIGQVVPLTISRAMCDVDIDGRVDRRRNRDRDDEDRDRDRARSDRHRRRSPSRAAPDPPPPPSPPETPEMPEMPEPPSPPETPLPPQSEP